MKVSKGGDSGLFVGRALITIGALCGIILLLARSARPQSATGPNWNPVVGPPAGAKYVGEEVCASCHVQEAATYKNAEMSHAGRLPVNAEILRDHPLLVAQLGPYHYQIVRRGWESIYTVSDGKQAISAPILWAFGKPVGGQTYVLQRNGAYYQGSVSFYTDINGLGITLGAPWATPKTLEDAFGQRLPQQDAQLCIACHTTGSVIGGVFNPENSFPNVTCEACHGPGGQHVEALQQGKPAEAAAAIINPGRQDPYDLDDFCGSCHRTWAMVVRAGITGVANVRFQPYRLELSACWSATNGALGCLACHDPHKPLVRNIAFYDSKCLACHLERGGKAMANHPGRACPVSTHDCVNCHMPRYEIPGSHLHFFDHDIRVARAGQPYPE